MEETPPATILVVDDEPDLVDLYAEWLAPTYDVRTADRGDAALDQLDGTVDIVLLDRRMPGLSGEEVLETIRDRDLDCRVALVTSVEPDFDILDLGFDDYLQKPVSETTLHDLVESLLTRTHYSDRIRDYAALMSKQAALQAEKESEKLANNPDFEQLQAEIENLRQDINTLMGDFTDEDFVAAFHDIS